ncbi:MAG: hypothetical protein OXP66_11310, partial [Candidatus Tectomicrobia bacterium]|nr:hypothetical protein [Candidatus Tectomicrobia bacterium]
MTKTRRTWEKAFLCTLEKTGIVGWAAKAAGVGRRTVYDHRQADSDFAERWEEALDTAEDNLLGEVIRRAVEGEQVPVYYKGKVVGHTTRKSDTLLMFAVREMQRRRERVAPKDTSLRRFFTGGAPTDSRRPSRPTRATTGASAALAMESLPDAAATPTVQRSSGVLRNGAPTASCQRPVARRPLTFGGNVKRRLAAPRLWSRWPSLIPVLATAPWRRPLMA